MSKKELQDFADRMWASLEVFVNTGDSHGEASYQSGSCRSRERSQDFADRMWPSLE